MRTLTATWIAFLALVGAAQAATPAKLLTRYQPVTTFDVGETFRPTSVETFVSDSNLELHVATDPYAAGTWTVANASPDINGLPLPGSGSWRLNQRTCSPALGVAGMSCYAAAWSGHGAPSVVYGRVARFGPQVVLQYWYFYYENFYSYAYPASDFVWQAHEGDWEVVNVVLRRARRAVGGRRPLRARSVGYSQHCTGERRAWSQVPRWRRSHPIVHVAIGSHANYFGPGTHPIAVECLPPQAVTLLQQNGLALPVDFTSNGAVAGPPARGGEVTSIVRVTGLAPAWIRFPGTWGEQQFFHAPAPIGTVALGASPVGPALQAAWRRPLATLAAWARR